MLKINLLGKLLLPTLLLATQIYAKTNYPVVIESGTPAVLAQLNSAAKAQNIAKKPIGELMQWTALQLLDKPYEPALLDRSVPEYLYISLNQTDCMLFIEEVFAYSNMLKHKQSSLDDLASGIRDVRYHGEVAYCNRNHYYKDWALSNINDGLFIDVARELTNQYSSYPVDVLSQRIAKQPIHAADVACIKSREDYINTQKLGFISMKELPKYLSKIKAGDLIGIVRTPNGKADSVYHLGIAYIHDGKVGMIHASSLQKKVVIADTLTGYLGKFDNSQGIILLRAK
ncbi:MAG: hypothetical protein K0R14_1773 [Burkholderiales bacterium]|jgi:hypothetical protein|nr:hypothetical protein [Burkholderiales bacterium]